MGKLELFLNPGYNPAQIQGLIMQKEKQSALLYLGCRYVFICPDEKDVGAEPIYWRPFHFCKAVCLGIFWFWLSDHHTKNTPSCISGCDDMPLDTKSTWFSIPALVKYRSLTSLLGFALSITLTCSLINHPLATYPIRTRSHILVEINFAELWS